MEIELIFKIAAIGIIVAVLNQILSKSGRDEYAMLTVLTGIVAVSYTHLTLPTNSRV